MNNLKIEKGIPIPERKPSGFSATFRKMEIGDSVFIPGKTTSDVSSLTTYCRPMKYMGRAEEGGVRVWRIE